MTLVWEYSRFKGTRLLLMLAIADHCNDDLIAWPGLIHLSHKIRMSRRYTQGLIDELLAAKPQELKLLDPGGGRGHSPRYQIVISEHANGLRTRGKMDVHKGRGGPHLLLKGEAGSTLSENKGRGGQPIKGEARLQKNHKGRGGPPQRARRASPEPSRTPTNTLTTTATDRRPAAAAVDVSWWNLQTLIAASKLPKARRQQLEASSPSAGAYVSKYLYALAHAGLNKPPLWAASQVTENPGAWEGEPFESLAGLGPVGLAHVLAWIRDDAAYPLTANGASGAGMALRAMLQARHAKEPARMYAGVNDTIIDLGLNALAQLATPDEAMVPGEMAPEPEPDSEPDAWALLVGELRRQVGGPAYDRLCRCHLVSAEAGRLIVAVPTGQEFDWLSRQMGRELARRGVSLQQAAE